VKQSRSRPAHGYERAVSVFGIVVAVLMALAGLTVAGFAVVFFVGMSQWGNNK
jgi:biopolymer transport protein ExbB/TolQ